MLTLHIYSLNFYVDPSVLIGCIVLLGLYLGAIRFHLTLIATSFVAGIVVLLLSLSSPLDTLSDIYLFSAHMLQHLLLLLVVPPLLIMGIPASVVKELLSWKPADRVEKFLSRPLIAWFLGVGTIWIWHIPFLYELTLNNQTIHIFEHLLFLATSVIFWWPVITPLKNRRMVPATAIIYLFAAMISNSALGIFLTFAPAGLYPGYINPNDILGILPQIRSEWGLTAAVDQQIGGLMMWIPSNLIYLFGVLVEVARWFNENETGPSYDTSRPEDNPGEET